MDLPPKSAYLSSFMLLPQKIQAQPAQRSKKRAWDAEQDRMLLKMISEIGPLQWE